MAFASYLMVTGLEECYITQKMTEFHYYSAFDNETFDKRFPKFV